MNNRLVELLPNPVMVDYQVPHNGQGADFYDDAKMSEYGQRVVKECIFLILQQTHIPPQYRNDIIRVLKTTFKDEECNTF